MNSTTAKVQNLEWEYIDDAIKVLDTAVKLRNGTGPVGIDVERASGYRYSQKAYLIQIFRKGSGTFLIDPLYSGSLEAIAAAIKDEEWVIHAAHSDLESLIDAGLKPNKIFDTELASRLLGFERVGLGSVTQELLGVSLEKAFSRADWSVRPLPGPWLEYAALDVVLLPDLQKRTKALLLEAGKEEFATQEFEALLERPVKTVAPEPWKKVSGYGRLRNQKTKNIAKELWLAREKFAQKHDLAPNRVLPNSSIIAAALMDPRSPKLLAKNKEFSGKYSRKELPRWWNAIAKAKIQTPVGNSQHKDFENHVDAPPKNIKVWEKKNPAAYERLTAAKELLREEAERLNIPPENLLPPQIVKALSWDPPIELDKQSISNALALEGARPWQRDLTSQIIVDSFVESL